MKTRIKITETQMKRLMTLIEENTVHSSIVKQMKEELDANYEHIEKFVHKGGEYYDKPMIQVKIDGQVITPKDLYEYLKYKYKAGDNFIKQVIRDWVDDKITDTYGLSKNVPLNEGDIMK